jgi:alpha-N-arabinofuranosidase
MNKMTINADHTVGQISRHIYGHFAEHLGHCIYDGIWVGEESPIPNVRGIRSSIVEALRGIRIPNLRWPGGCFADEYHWQDGIGPRSDRPTMINTHWGGVGESNAFGTHEFMDLCEQLGCEPYICGNVGSGTVREMSNWVEYLTTASDSTVARRRRANGRDEPWKMKFWGVGNENWECGGQMRPEYYADLYRRYNVYCRNYSGNELFRIACGAPDSNYEWTRVLMRQAGSMMDGLSLHYYVQTRFQPTPVTSYATDFDESGWFEFLHRALAMDTLITRHSAIMDQHDPEKRVALVVDEWGAWYEVEKGTNPGFLFQQNTMRDALIASITLDIFNAHCDRVRMANLAQTVNVLQAPILTDGPTTILTPTYHVFDLYKDHQDAQRLSSVIQSERYEFEERAMNAIGGTASMGANGTLHVTLNNRDPNRDQPLTVELRGTRPAKVTARILCGKQMNSHNTKEEPERVTVRDFDEVKLKSTAITLTLPAISVVGLDIDTT